MSKTVLAADIGTSSLKTALIDEEGKILAYSRRSFLFRYTNHAAEEWMSALKSCASDINLQLAGALPQIDAICISGNGPTLVGENGETLFWNTPVEQKDSSLFISRILEFKNRYKMSWAFGKNIFSGPEYLIWKLTEKAVTILPEERYSDAYWTKERLIKAGLTEQEAEKLPPFAAPGTSAGPLCAKAAEFLLPAIPTISPDLEVYCGAPDFIAAVIGTNTLKPGAICDRAGSSEGLNLCTDKPIFDTQIRTLPSVIPGLWNASYLIPDSGTKFSLYKQKIERMRGIQNLSYTDLLNDIMSEEKCMEDPVLLEGKSLVEIILGEIQKGYSILCEKAKENGCPVSDTMHVSGGQASNRQWIQMKSKSLGTKLSVSECTDAELLGDAAIAFTSMGIYRNLQEAAEKITSGKQEIFLP